MHFSWYSDFICYMKFGTLGSFLFKIHVVYRILFVSLFFYSGFDYQYIKKLHRLTMIVVIRFSMESTYKI